MHNCSHIFVDLDGTLIKQNICFELFKTLIWRHPLVALKIQFNYFLNQKQLNIDILARYSNYVNVHKLRFHDELLSFLTKARNSGKKIILATGSPVKLGEKVNYFLNNLFDHVIGSYGQLRCVSQNKLDEIKKYALNNRFMYIGNSKQDIAVWHGSDLCGAVAHTSFIDEISTKYDISFAITFKDFKKIKSNGD